MKTCKKPLILVLSALIPLALASCDIKDDIKYKVNFDVDINGVSIDFWTGFGAKIVDSLVELIGQFEEETGVTVKHESKGGYDDLKKAIDLSATATKYPHLALGYPDHFVGYVEKDIIVRLDYYFENGGTYDYGDYEEEDRAFKIEDFYEDYMIENQTIEWKSDTEGWTLGVPFNKSTEIMTFNETFFNWAQVKNPEIVIPTTWNELGIVGPKITNLLRPYFGKVIGSNDLAYANAHQAAAGGATVVLDLTNTTESLFRPISYDSQANLFITTVRQFGGTYTEVDRETGKGYLAYNSQETINGLQKLRDLFNANVLGVPKVWQESKYSSGPFKDIMAVMAIGSTAGVANNAPAGNKFTLSAAPILYNDPNQKYVISQGTNLCLLDKGTEAERVAAWRLLQYLSKYANAEFAERTSYFPSCEYAENSVYYQGFLENPGLSTAEIIKMKVAKVNSEVYIDSAQNWTKFVDPPFLGSAFVRLEVGTISDSIFYEQNKTIKQILDESYVRLSDFVRP